MSDRIGMGQDGFGDIIFTISVNFRDTRANVWRRNESLWESDRLPGGIDWIIDLLDYLRFKRNLLIGRLTAEKSIVEIGSAMPLETEMAKRIRGRDSESGFPNEIEFTSIELRKVLDFPLLKSWEGHSRHI